MMDFKRFEKITGAYPGLRIGILGDFCLDQYLEIDPGKEEISIETGLPVYNITQIRRQPGASGTILNNLSALGVGKIYPIGFTGKDAEGWALRHALMERRGVCLDYFIESESQFTFTYTKPLVMHADSPPEELNRLDLKNWKNTPESLAQQWIQTVEKLILGDEIDALIVMDQVDYPETGVVTQSVLRALKEILRNRQLGGTFWAIADSRQGLTGFPQGLTFKMNHHELDRMLGGSRAGNTELAESNESAGLKSAWIQESARELASRHGSPVIVSCAENGIIAASPDGDLVSQPAHPVRGPIDIVGAGDSVTANLTAALASGASLGEALELAMAGASIVIHQLGDTGVASQEKIRGLLFGAEPLE